MVDGYGMDETADRTGISVDDLQRLVDLGIVRPDGDGRFSPGDVRRVGMVHSLVEAGVPLDGLGAAMRSGQVSLAFLDAPAFERFSTLSGATFADEAARTGLPIELLLFIREAAGSGAPLPGDRLRAEELSYVELIAAQIQAGFRPAAIEQMLRSQGDTIGRMAETESAIWQSEVILPATAAGKRPDEILGVDFADAMSVLTEQAVVSMYHMQQTRAWTTNIIEGLEVMLAEAGLHIRLEHPPAMCFLDITGYTRLTQEHGDAAAAQLATELGRLVNRTSIRYGGRAVKWLGDGVMLHFPDPGQGVVAALDMVAGVSSAGLPRRTSACTLAR
jgi:DNA-binding transcriptional MerR regulator